MYRFLLLACISGSAMAMQFDKVTIELGHPANGSMVHLEDAKLLAVSGFSQFERWLSLVNLAGDFNVQPVAIPANAQYFSQARLIETDRAQNGPVSRQALVFLTLDGISVYYPQAGQTEPLISSSSLYRVLDKNRLRSSEFVLQLGSERADFLIPDFNHSHLFRQQADGSFKQYSLNIDALVTSWRDSPSYEPRRYYIADVDLDGRRDLVFIAGGKFQVFYQLADGAFNTEPVTQNWPVALSTEQQADQRNDAGRSYTGQNIDSVRDITDIDGDGIADIVVNREQLADALERTNSFRVHFGKQSVTGLQFNAEPETQITTDTSPIAVMIDDFNADGRKDFYISSTHFGVGTIVRVLLRGSANLDIDFYLLNGQRQYNSKADFQQNAVIDVSISNLRYDMPLFELADLDGSDQQSLIVGEGGDELRFYSPEPERLFSRRSERVKLPLPRDARKVMVADLTGNGKDDIVLPFDAQDKEGQRNQLLLLMNTQSD
ncbi:MULTISPECIES: FG-GAP repeat domain-containing protein [unclassified Arsukibacterium]|uniref:FG-GAP repeat domain-containing protein n=1 Tax=unclassified Arsukibacterium TaxID=2635278 RepID=UPI0025C05A48|nr:MULTISPECIES: VCBS repeat-containing protein [unclassified Arsukibacterium]|tara:strand:- start:11479 stop:12951 length:1473 start_codon:yes stop_codon:yes gene_type:complete